MNRVDANGQSLSGASAAAAELFNTALHDLQCYHGDPVASVQQALADSPEFVMGHALMAWLHLLGTEPAGLPVARDALRVVDGLRCTPRERAHLTAIGQMADGHWRAAALSLEDLSIEHPRDALALQAGHVLDFALGDSRMLRDRIARALPAWSADMPGHHALLGMLAFGLEETGHYAEAEAAGRAAVAADRSDAWAWHAVAHVLEMQDRIEEGIAWLRSDSPAWSENCSFAVHNWWHLALHHLERGEHAEVLALFDGPIFGHRPTMVLDLIDASALLWRLQLRGVDVADRWQDVAGAWAPHAHASWYAFNDVHALMAFAAAGHRDLVTALSASQGRALLAAGDNAGFTAEVGAPLAQGLLAFVEGDYRRAAGLLRRVRPLAQRFGGSHAQRDLIDQTLIEAALRGGDHALARALTAERAARQPSRASARGLLRRALTLQPQRLAA